MAKPYAAEMATLADTFAWAKAADVRPLRQAVRTAGLSPLVAIGSGGSFSAAHAMANMHQRSTGRLATVATPLETITGSLEPAIATWLLSAGGGNVDVLSAARAMIAREPRQIAVLARSRGCADRRRVRAKSAAPRSAAARDPERLRRALR
jgi:hypothetical protein